MARAIALVAVAYELLCTARPGRFLPEMDSSLLALAGVVAILTVDNCSATPMGLRLSPIQGWWYWIRLGIQFGLMILMLLGMYVALCRACGWKIPTYPVPPAEVSSRFYWMCIYSPLTEEIIYRSFWTTAVLRTCGERWTIFLGGLLFALAHVLRGIPSPENQVAGFMLGWALLKSGTILVSLAMHSAGNLSALLSQIATWYWQSTNV